MHEGPWTAASENLVHIVNDFHDVELKSTPNTRVGIFFFCLVAHLK
jgi:hypothetical protein